MLAQAALWGTDAIEVVLFPMQLDALVRWREFEWDLDLGVERIGQ